MDEMEVYRERIERRYHDRRQTGPHETEQYKPPAFWSPELLIIAATLAIAVIALAHS